MSMIGISREGLLCKRFICASILLVSPLLSTCKTVQKKSSEEKAINALSGSTEQPICSAPADENFNTFYDGLWPDPNNASDKGSIHAHPGYKKYLAKIMPTIPQNLMKWYFGLGGELTLIANVTEMCSDLGSPSVMIPFTNDRGEPAGCLRSLSPVGSSSQGIQVEMPHMYVQIRIENNSPESVYKSASNIVQGFGLLASYFASELAKTSSGDALFFGNSELEEDKQKLAFFLADDIVNSKNLGKITETPNFVKEIAFDQSIFDQSLDRNTRWMKFKDPNNQNKVEYSKFLNLVFAQVLVADMCNDLTRGQISKSGDFPTLGQQYYNDTRAAFFAALGVKNAKIPQPESGGPQTTDSSSATDSTANSSSPSTSTSPQVSADDEPIGDITAPPQSAPDFSKSLGLSGGSNSDASLNSEPAPMPANNGGFGLNEGRNFPILAAVIQFPFAVSRFLVQNQPIRTFFKDYQPIRNTARFAVNTIGVVANGGRVIVNTAGRVVVGTVHVAGRAVVGTLNAAGRVVHYTAVGTIKVVGVTGRLAMRTVTFPFRVLRFGRR